MSLTGYIDFITLPLVCVGAILTFKEHFSDRFIMWLSVFILSTLYVCSVRGY